MTDKEKIYDSNGNEIDPAEFDLEAIEEEFGDGCCSDGCKTITDEDGNKRYEWNMICAFDRVLHYSRDGQCGLGGGNKSKSAMDYLKERLGMTDMQIIIIAALIDNGKAMSWGDMASHLDISRLRMMTYTEQIEDLVYNRRWLEKAVVHNHGDRYEGYKLVYGVIRAIRHNELFQPEKLDGLDEQSFVEHVVEVVNANNNVFADAEDPANEDERHQLMNLVKLNPQLPLCKVIQDMDCDTYNRCLLLYFVSDYARCAKMHDEGLSIDELDASFPEDRKCNYMRQDLTSGNHKLIKDGWVEPKCEDGFADVIRYVLTQKTKDELLAGFKPAGAKVEPKGKATDRDLISYKDIEKKQLYYNEKEQSIVNRLRKMLSTEQFPVIQQRLKDEGMRTGVAILLNGGPGTGKTELARQLSLETQRDLLMIDIAQVKDKFVGESEKNTKAIFERYKRLYKDREQSPILFLNECDAILSRRIGVEHSTDQMSNTMQNILLQCLEDFEGIVICTSNLADKALDKAFMRRFLIKAEFTKPDATVRAHIWQSMLPALDDNDALYLAEHYDFSGGQIENIKRKMTIEHIINGADVTLDILCEFCDEENVLEKANRCPVIGFSR